MHVQSFLPLVGITLLNSVLAQDNSTQAVTYAGAVNAIGNSSDSSPSRRWIPPQQYSRRHELDKRTSSGICDSLPNKWTYMGCFSDSPSLRVLDGPSECLDTQGSSGLTQEKCIEFCDAQGYSVAGVEWGQECYCGYTLDSSATKEPETDCSKPCTGNGDEVCGNGGRMNVFTNGDTAPAVLASTGNFNSLGCYSDSASARTLTTQISLTGNVRVSDCTTACAGKGFPYAGLEFGNQCFCGASIQNGGAPIADKQCDMACTADKTQYCGGRAAINIYKSTVPVQGPSIIPTGWESLSCYTDSPSSRTLAYHVPNFNSFSMAQCISECDKLGYNVAGTEYGSECYCDNTIADSSSASSSGCDMSCTGNTADTCGGAGHINLYTRICTGTAGCHFGYGYLGETLGGTLEQCQESCRQDPNCVDTQYGIDPLFSKQPFCNHFKYPIQLVLYSGHDSRCDSFTFYPAACVF